MSDTKDLVKWDSLAVGMNLGVWDDAEDALHFPFSFDLTDGHFWRPHRDDGDSRRLEVALKITVSQGSVAVWARTPGWPRSCWEPTKGGRAAATRFAVLRAAAAKGCHDEQQPG